VAVSLSAHCGLSDRRRLDGVSYSWKRPHGAGAHGHSSGQGPLLDTNETRWLRQLEAAYRWSRPSAIVNAQPSRITRSGTKTHQCS
jgi:hypothetical protein